MNIEELNKPDKSRSLDEWLHFLELIHPQTIELGLERVTKVAKKLGVLKPSPYVFTVAGTNGKGTTCRALEMILIEAGFRVGVYSSPHLMRYTERVRINNQVLADDLHISAFINIEAMRDGTSLTYFEYSTLSALWLFKQANLDVVILEVGLGGRLDATNIVDADVAVITSIALDHMDYLGNTRDSIGREKAGIIKPNQVVIVGEPDIPSSIEDVARLKQVNLHRCKPNLDYDWSYQLEEDSNSWRFCSEKFCSEKLPIANIPLANAATALAALCYSSFDLEKQIICRGLLKTALTGRFQILSQSPLVILDVAHNPHAAAYLNSRLQQLVNSQTDFGSVRIVIGMLKDKDIASTVKILRADSWYCASLYGERGSNAQDIAKYIEKNGDTTVKTFPSVLAAFEQAKYDANEEDIIVVCGSFHTVSEVLSSVENE